MSSLLIFICDTQADAQKVVQSYGPEKVQDLGPQPIMPTLIYEGADETVAPKLEYHTGKWVVAVRP